MLSQKKSLSLLTSNRIDLEMSCLLKQEHHFIDFERKGSIYNFEHMILLEEGIFIVNSNFCFNQKINISIDSSWIENYLKSTNCKERLRELWEWNYLCLYSYESTFLHLNSNSFKQDINEIFVPKEIGEQVSLFESLKKHSYNTYIIRKTV